VQEHRLGLHPRLAQAGEVSRPAGESGLDGRREQLVAWCEGSVARLVQGGLGDRPPARPQAQPTEQQAMPVAQQRPADVPVQGPAHQVLGGGELAQRQGDRRAERVRRVGEHQAPVRRFEQLGCLEERRQRPACALTGGGEEPFSGQRQRLELERGGNRQAGPGG
jgi:hypothetical protein